MKYIIDNKEYEVVIIKKRNKNTYIRVKSDLKIYITTNYLASRSYIKELLDKNSFEIKKMIEKVDKKNKKNEQFYYLGKVYDIIIVPSLNNIDFDDDRIYVKDINYLNKWLEKQIINLFQEKLNYYYNLFEENIPNPNLKIRKMTSRWGVCNRKNNNVTLNSELIKYNEECLNYVIVHELSHFVHFDHSKYFWQTVNKYYPNYKDIRKILKD